MLELFTSIYNINGYYNSIIPPSYIFYQNYNKKQVCLEDDVIVMGIL